MIRYGNRLTLSEVDVRRWTRITGFEPTAIATVADLEEYVRECKRYYAEPSDDSAWRKPHSKERKTRRRVRGRGAGCKGIPLWNLRTCHAHRRDVEDS